MTKLKVKQVADSIWLVEEYNNDFTKEVIVWIDLKGIHCNCCMPAFKAIKKCKHILKVEKLVK